MPIYRLTLTLGDGRQRETLETTLSEFLDSNDFDREEIMDIVRTLDAGEKYSGGGGAAPTFTLKAKQ